VNDSTRKFEVNRVDVFRTTCIIPGHFAVASLRIVNQVVEQPNATGGYHDRWLHVAVSDNSRPTS